MNESDFNRDFEEKARLFQRSTTGLDDISRCSRSLHGDAFIITSRVVVEGRRGQLKAREILTINAGQLSCRIMLIKTLIFIEDVSTLVAAAISQSNNEVCYSRLFVLYTP